jgi:hypothetical protein
LLILERMVMFLGYMYTMWNWVIAKAEGSTFSYTLSPSFLR